MNGLTLAEDYFETFGKPMLETYFPDLKNRAAIGLVGMGSECLGVDDALSRDHDWGPGFCIWLNSNDFQCVGPELQRRYDEMPQHFNGLHRRTSSFGAGRMGVHETEGFYRSFTGLPQAPQKLLEWLVIPEYNLAALAGGKVFHDSYGHFSAIRDRIVDYYPEDVRLKKMAARCMSAARSGQYNYTRCLARGESYAATSTLVGFCEDILAIAFLLNHKFMPYYKWHRQIAAELPVLGKEISDAVSSLCRGDVAEKNIKRIAECCTAIADEFTHQGLSRAKGNALLDHGPQIFGQIEAPDLRQFDIWYRGG